MRDDAFLNRCAVDGVSTYQDTLFHALPLGSSLHSQGKAIIGVAPPSRTSASSSSTAVQAAAAGAVTGGHNGGARGDHKQARPRPSLTRKGSAYEPDEGPVLLARPPGVGVVPGTGPSP